MTNRKFRVFHDSKTGLSNCKDFLVDENDLAEQLLGLPPDNRFLGIYSKEELHELLYQNGIFGALNERGFSEVKLSLKLKDNFEHVLRLYDTEEKVENLLAEMVVRKAYLPAEEFPATYRASEKMEVLFVEWLQAQNPQVIISEEKPLLPGQRYSGLGLATALLDLLIIFAKKMNVYAIAAIPGHYHNAVIFSKYFRYVNPKSEGRLLALKRDLAQLELSRLSWAVEFNCIKISNTEAYLKWFLDWQVFPIKQKLLQYFDSEDYQKSVNKVAAEYDFELDEALFESKKAQINRIKEAII